MAPLDLVPPPLSLTPHRFLVGALAWFFLGSACGSEGPSDRGAPAGSHSSTGGSSQTGAGGASGSTGTGNTEIAGPFGSGGTGAIGGLDADSGTGSSSSDPGACATTSAGAMIVKQPVDIILVLDNSGSMADELAAVEKNINVNFAKILTTAAVDYRIILVSRHRRTVRTESGEASTSICVEAPLSGLAHCPDSASSPEAPAPVFSERFYQYNSKIESHDSWETGILAGYDSKDDKGKAPNGWKPWLRLGAKKVILEMSDDDEGVDKDTNKLTVDQFLTQLTQKAPEFGADAQHPSFVFHSIIGIAEKAPATSAYLPNEPVEMGICKGNGDQVTNSAPTYQELSRRTGGLRFPICQFTGYDAVFQKIADDVIAKAQLACDFAIPAPPAGEKLDLSKVAVNYAKGNGSGSTQFGQAATKDKCQANAFYIDNNRIYLCKDTCDTVQNDGKAKVDVLFTCASTIISVN